MNNFVFHEEYIIDLPTDKKSEFLNYIVDYGLYEIEPKLKGFEQVYWMSIKRRIDLEKCYYEETCLKRKINAINSRINADKETENDRQNLISFKTRLNELNEVKRNNSFKTKYTESQQVKRTHYVNDIDIVNDIVNVNVNDIDIVNDNVSASDDAPITSTPSQSVYSKKIFTLFKDAGLPCSRENEISFLQTDFSNALNYLHKTPEYKSISSDDVIGAVKNYIQVYSDSDSYVTNKMNFYSLVKSKMFYNLLPANFDAGNFKKFGTEKEPQKEDQKPKIKTYRKCPKCNAEKLWYNSKAQSYFCDNCFATVRSDEL